MKVLVLGGRGFIGRNVVSALKSEGVEVLIGSRFEGSADQTARKIQMQLMLHTNNWLTVLDEVDVVVNCVGILRERLGESYRAIHELAPAALAKGCKLKGKRMIHVSALGLSLHAKSRFIQSKHMGERAIVASGAEAVIVRPSLLDGEGGFGAKWFRRVARWPVMPIMQTDGSIAPLQAEDLGIAIANLCAIPSRILPKEVDLGGSQILTMQQYLVALRRIYTDKPVLIVRLPKWMVRLASHVCDLLHVTPLSFGHFELMQGYNVPTQNLLGELLGRNPQGVGVVSAIDKEVGLGEIQGALKA